jgi:hypothetical protein
MSARIVPVPPTPDGLTMAFAAARRRRAGKASVTAFGVAVAMASALSLLAPAGQTLVEEPLPPAGHVGQVPGVVVAPPAAVPATRPARTPSTSHPPTAIPPVARAVRTTRAHTSARPRPGHVTTLPAAACRRDAWLACASVRRRAEPGRASASAALCRTAVWVTVDVTSSAQPSTRYEVRSGRCGSP